MLRLAYGSCSDDAYKGLAQFNRHPGAHASHVDLIIKLARLRDGDLILHRIISCEPKFAPIHWNAFNGQQSRGHQCLERSL